MGSSRGWRSRATVSWEKPKKKRLRSLAVDDIGLSPASVALVYSS